MSSKKIMTGAEFCRIRRALNFSQDALADFFRLGRWGGKTVRRWESEETNIPGPVACAILGMKKLADEGHDPQDIMEGRNV